MATHASATKAAKQAVVRNQRNNQARARFRTIVKNLRTVTKSKVGKDAEKILQPLLNEAQKILMKAASKNLIKKKTASRYISRLSQAVHKATHA
ncbi:MAG: 30S ribosomal protein S20 [Deltaproteobacteria bacterium]|nr:30S ribosomal protein S20 [Deltaproteobacteria bacterium]MBM4316990.1 30S ribosomal protein S20 [Deltaproteobacteria bacterium]